MSKTKAERLTDELRSCIIEHTYRYRDKLPTEMALVEKYSVSRQTVRKALAALVSEGLLESIQGSGYYVTYNLKNSQKCMRIAVIATYITEYIFPLILNGIERTASENGYSVMITATNNSIASERAILENLMKNPVDGILVEGTKTALPNPNIIYYRKLADSGIPIVFFNGYYASLEHPDIKHVVVDDYNGGRMLVRYLIDHGHEKIGGIFKSDDIQGNLRFSGFIDELMESGVGYSDSSIAWFTIENKYVFLNGINTGSMLKNIMNTCTAIVCFNDEIAYQLTMILDNTPETAVRTIVSFDHHKDIRSTSGIEVLSLGFPKDTMGRTITEKLIRMIDCAGEESETLDWLPLQASC